MTKKSRSSQSSKRTFIITLIVLALIIGGAAWISTANSATTTAPVITSQRITPLEYQNEFGDGTPHLLIDVRTPEEFTSGHIQNAVNIPVETLQTRLEEVPGGTLLSWSTAAAATAAPPQRRSWLRTAINIFTISVESKIG